jgi:hypothetical protein
MFITCLLQLVYYTEFKTEATFLVTMVPTHYMNIFTLLAKETTSYQEIYHKRSSEN